MLDQAVTTKLAVGTRVGEYEVTGVLGAGGMGTVYAGVHPVIGKRVAIKVLNAALSSDPRMVGRFVQEARAVVKIQHHSIIDVFAFGHEDAVGHYFVMPLLDGQSLGQRIEERGPLPAADALRVVEQIADALDAAHAVGVFHRDLKPDNVFLARARGDELSVRVLDFGIAKLLDGEVSTTQTGAQMGTPLFMSPEQWDGAAVDHRTDIYALGVLVHHALTGRFPFESRSPVALMNMHANQPPMPASTYGADPAVDAVIARALAKHRDQRFASAGELSRALAAAVGDGIMRGPAAVTPAPSSGALAPEAVTLAPSAGALATASRSDGDSWSPAPSARRRWLGAVVAVVALAGVAVVIAVTTRTAGGPSASAPDAALPALSPAATDAGGLDAQAATPTSFVDAARPRDAPARKSPVPDAPRARPPADAPTKATAPDAPTKATSAADAPRARPPVDAATKNDPPKPGDKTQWGDTVKPF